jgi:hypothetical protein
MRGMPQVEDQAAMKRAGKEVIEVHCITWITPHIFYYALPVMPPPQAWLIGAHEACEKADER